MPSTAGIKAGKAFIVIDAMDMTARAFAGIRRNILSLGTTMTSVGQTIAVNSALLFTPFLAGMKAFAEFDNELRKLVAKSTGRLSDLAEMEKFVLDLSRKIGFSAGEIAITARSLVERGFEGERLKKVLPHVLLLAKAAGDSAEASTDLRHAAGTVAGILSAYRMGADKAAEVTDLLATVVNKTNINLEDMNVIVSYAATVAAEYRVELAELMAVMGIFRDVNMDASVAATAFRNILLYSTSKGELDKFNEKLKELTGYVIEFTDESGRLKSPIIFLTAIGELLKKIPDETIRGELLSNLFGTRSTVPSMQIIKNIDKIAEYILEFKNVSGSAKKMADFMSSGIGGVFGRIASDISALVASFKVLTPTVEFFGGIIRSVSEWLQAFIGRNSQLIDGIIKLIAISGVFGVSLIILGKIVRMFGGIFTPVVYVLKTISTILRNLPLPIDKVAYSILGLSKLSYKLTRITFGSWNRGIHEAMSRVGDSLTRVAKKGLHTINVMEKLRKFRGWSIRLPYFEFLKYGGIGIFKSVNDAVRAASVLRKTLLGMEGVIEGFYKKTILMKKGGEELMIVARFTSGQILQSFVHKGLMKSADVTNEAITILANKLASSIDIIRKSGAHKFITRHLLGNIRLAKVFQTTMFQVSHTLSGMRSSVSLLGGGLKASAIQLFVIKKTFQDIGGISKLVAKDVVRDTTRILNHNKRLVEVTIFGITRTARVSAAAVEAAIRSTRQPMLLWLRLTRLVARETGYLRFGWDLVSTSFMRFISLFRSLSGIKWLFGGTLKTIWNIVSLVTYPLKEGFLVIWNIIKKGWNTALEITANWIVKIATDPVGFLINAIGIVVAGFVAMHVAAASLGIIMGTLKAVGSSVAMLFTSILSSLPMLAERGLAKVFEVGKNLMELLSTITEYVKIAIDMERYDIAAKVTMLGLKIAFHELKNAFLDAYPEMVAGFNTLIRIIKELIEKVFEFGDSLFSVSVNISSVLAPGVAAGLKGTYKMFKSAMQRIVGGTVKYAADRWNEIYDEELAKIKGRSAIRRDELGQMYSTLEYYKGVLRLMSGKNPELERLEEKYNRGAVNIQRASVPPERPMSAPIEGYHELPEEIGGGRIWIGRGESPAVAAMRNRMLESARRSIRPAEIVDQPMKYDVLKAAEARSSEAFRAFFENKMNTDMAKSTVERLGEISRRLGPLSTMSDDIARIRELMEE